MPAYQFGDVVLAEFPFADANEMKRRPALILSVDKDDDVILLRITSKIRETTTDVMLRDWNKEGLRLPSIVRLEKVVTSNKIYILRSLGKLTKQDAFRVLSGLRMSCENIVSFYNTREGG